MGSLTRIQAPGKSTARFLAGAARPEVLGSAAVSDHRYGVAVVGCGEVGARRAASAAAHPWSELRVAVDPDIVRAQARCQPSEAIIQAAVALTRATRDDSRIRRGASVRAAIAIADLATMLDGDLDRAAELALPTRIELVDDRGSDLSALLEELKKKARRVSPSLS